MAWIELYSPLAGDDGDWLPVAGGTIAELVTAGWREVHRDGDLSPFVWEERKIEGHKVELQLALDDLSWKGEGDEIDVVFSVDGGTDLDRKGRAGVAIFGAIRRMVREAVAASPSWSTIRCQVKIGEEKRTAPYVRFFSRFGSVSTSPSEDGDGWTELVCRR